MVLDNIKERAKMNRQKIVLPEGEDSRTIEAAAMCASQGIAKPILLGRGLAVPMPVVLIGALGGMATAGLVGLFLGAVILGVGYQIFMSWVNEDPEQTPAESAPPAEETSASA